MTKSKSKSSASATVKHYRGARIELGKRTNVPCVVRSPCPACGKVSVKDLRSEDGDYLSYPRVNVALSLDFMCKDEKCQTEWSVQAELTLKLTVL